MITNNSMLQLSIQYELIDLWFQELYHKLLYILNDV